MCLDYIILKLYKNFINRPVYVCVGLCVFCLPVLT